MATKPLTQTTGRRKEAVARARLRQGTGLVTINGRPFDVYFPTAAQRMVVSEPLRVAEVEEAYDVDASIHGGGVTGQAGALRMAIARSLVELDPEKRALLQVAVSDTEAADKILRELMAKDTQSRLQFIM